MCVFRERETEEQIYYKELAYEIMKAEKSHNPFPASLRPGRFRDVVLVQVQRPEKQESRWCSFKPKVVKREKVSLIQRW